MKCWIDQSSNGFPEIWGDYLKNRSFLNNDFIWSERELSEQILSANSHFKGLYESGQLKSFILFHDLKGSFEILYLETHPQYLRKGLMGQLLKKVLEEWFPSNVWLDVHHQNQAAQKLYFKYGFLQTGRRDQYYKDGGDCLQLTLDRSLDVNS